MDKTTRNLLIFSAILIIAGLITLFVALRGDSNNTAAAENAIQCQTDSFICPNGSSVFRVAPNCEFAQCSNQASSAPSSAYKD